MPCWRRRPVDVDVHPRGQRVDDREADAVQAAGGDVRAAAELAAGVQLGRHHLDAGQPGLGLLVGRDAAAVVVDLDGVVGVQGDLDPVRGAGQRLVDAVVDDLPEAVHEAAGVGGADVHAGALADRLQPLEDEEVCRVVRVVDRGAPVSCDRRSARTNPAGCCSESTCDTPNAGRRHACRWFDLRSGLRWSNRAAYVGTSRCGNDPASSLADSATWRPRTSVTLITRSTRFPKVSEFRNGTTRTRVERPVIG